VVKNITFPTPLNTLFDGACCNSSCGADQACCAATSCSPTLRLCFRESQHPQDDTDSDCPFLQLERTMANQRFVVLGMDNLPIQRYYTVSDICVIIMMCKALLFVSLRVLFKSTSG
jgi:hypothetical protein